MRTLFILTAILLCSQGFSQKKAYIRFNNFRSPDSTYTKWTWEVNGEILSKYNDSIRVKINYPSLDTIIFRTNDTAAPERILTRFEKGHMYEIFAHGGGHEFDIMDKDISRYPTGYFDQEPLSEKDTVALRVENGTVQFLLVNVPDSLTVVGSFGDIIAGYTGGCIVRNDSISTRLSPFYTAYSDYLNHIVLGTAQIIDPQDIKENWQDQYHYMVVLNGPKETKLAVYQQELVNVQVRLFQQENLLLLYDFKTGKYHFEVQAKKP